jgi:PII-like signaling protein
MTNLLSDMETKAKKIRIYISNTDMYKHEPLYQMLIRTARELGLEGATIYKGIMGYGTSSDLKPPTLWQFTEKMPVTIEIIDCEAHILDYLQTIRPLLDKQPKGCMVTLQDVDVLFIKHGEH